MIGKNKNPVLQSQRFCSKIWMAIFQYCVHFISNIGEIRDMAPDETSPKGDFGAVPDLTEGKDAVDYIRSLRD